MIDLRKIERYKLGTEVALLPETKVRIEGWLYDNLHELADTIPSLQGGPKCPTELELYETDWESYSSFDGTERKPKLSYTMTFEAGFDDIVAQATQVSAEEITQTITKDWNRHGVRVQLTINIKAKMDPEYYSLLDALGFVHYNPGYTSPGAKVVSCKTHGGTSF